ncbi:Transmembrane protein [Parasponia andersonii]|uniref:Transmembrane protein n=1 Tax=Parasponia andersonii TaxID=3476 RepID=A0A2P5DZA7_PARAD|nr:Transmembrane protein [Parasponia andersonii]
MEVPVINRISNFDGGVTCLQNPSLLSQILSISGREKVFQAHSFWKWGAFIIAVIASFGTIISRIKILVIRLQCHFCKSSSASDPLLANFADEDFTTDEEDDDEDDAVSLSSSPEFDEDELSSPLSYSDEDFRVRSSGRYADQGHNRNLGLRRRRSLVDQRFSWSDFSSGKSVVKLWDSLGLGLGLDGGPAQDVVSVYDVDREQKLSSIFGGKLPTSAASAAATSSRGLILSAEASESGRLPLVVWDTRAACRIPAILAEWGPHLGKIVGVASNGDEKVYIRDDVTGGLTIGDLRNVSSPLKKLTEADTNETWWDADAVIVSSDESAASSRLDSAATRCCDAVRSYLL